MNLLESFDKLFYCLVVTLAIKNVHQLSSLGFHFQPLDFAMSVC